MKLVLLVLAIILISCRAEKRTYAVNKEGKLVEDILEIYQLKRNHIIAICTFEDKIMEVGWNTLKIETNGKFSDDDQFYAAGLCEGALTYRQIHDAFLNFLSGVLDGAQSLDNNTQDFITKQLNWMREQADANVEDPYWQLVGGMMQQLLGSYEGYRHATKDKPELELDFDHFYYLANMPDLEDVQPCFEGEEKTTKSCTIFVKYLGEKLISGHSTMNTFTQTLRIAKTYKFQLHNSKVLATTLTFSSRPGDFISKDDFFITDTGLNVMETSLLNFNLTNYQYIHYESLPCWVRLNIANRFASDPAEWSSIFEQHRSGTHNSQWIVIDYSKFNDRELDGFAYMVEEAFYYYYVTDVSQQLMNTSYLASYNRPVNKFLEKILEYNSTNLTYSINHDARRWLIPKYESKVDSTERVKWILRLNENGDTNDVCNAIGARCDLIPENASSGSVKDCFGTMDGKVTDNELIKEQKVWLINGPAYDYSKNIPPFVWTECPNLSHQGLPEKYEFPWILWNYKQPRNVRHEFD